MPRTPHRPSQLTGQIFRGSDAVRDGLLTVHQLRSSPWRRLLKDIYADVELDFDHGLMCHAATFLLPPGSVIAGPSAAWLLGVEWAADGRDDVHVIVPSGAVFGPLRGVRTHRAGYDPLDIRERDGLCLTGPLRTAWDVAVWCEVARAVPILDGMLGRALVSREQLDELIDSRAGHRGWRIAATAFSLADGRSPTPTDSLVRVRLVIAGLPRPDPAHPIALPGGVVLHPDLAWPAYRVAIELEGTGRADAPGRDRRRLSQLTSTGWLVIPANQQRIQQDFYALVREVRRALIARGWSPLPPRGTAVL